MTKLYKLMDKLMAYWLKKMSANAWYFFIMFGEILVFVLAILGIFQLIASALVKTTYFSQFDKIYLWFTPLLIFIFLLTALVFAHDHHYEKEYKEAKSRLANRSHADYVEKYKKYVDLVEGLLQKEEYQEVQLAKDWLQQFDKDLTNTASLCVERSQPYTDVEVATCLMYALTTLPSKDNSTLHTAFAFDCARQILNNPNVYQCNWLDGGELVLEVKDAFSIEYVTLSPDQLSFTISLLECYLSLGDTYDDVLKLADFLLVLNLYDDE